MRDGLMVNLRLELLVMADELREHAGQVVTAISMKSKALALRLNDRELSEEVAITRDIEELSRSLVADHVRMAQQLVDLATALQGEDVDSE